MDEWDADMISRVRSYMGRDPRVARKVTETITLLEEGFEVTLAELREAVDDAIARVPEKFRASAVVEQDVDYDTGRGPLEIKYQRLETPEEIEQNVGRALEYVRQSRAKDRREFERLVALFGKN